MAVLPGDVSSRFIASRTAGLGRDSGGTLAINVSGLRDSSTDGPLAPLVPPKYCHNNGANGFSTEKQSHCVTRLNRVVTNIGAVFTDL